ncbi:hypothetical protein [Amycolatopsis sp. PS_44_ISF1]|uniref:hypothetical protein n=1 Tax=Amycolatopsis sp. PS_44_ISF1 TaxID=2974917 RepID=UPI0028E05388|nr:hypothetical protein [Amycolatopsis sp. PS_44_ISF1]MDT8913640.1 hypothetical protein [Amycolatopsis sp. PS_44_ISF1]
MTRRRKCPLAAPLLTAVLIVGPSACAAGPVAGSSAATAPLTGSAVPAVTGTTADGHRVDAARRAVLLAFVDFTGGLGSPSRSQLVVLKSAATQHAGDALVLAVDGTGRASDDELVNAANDWDLGRAGVAVLGKASGAAAAAVYRPATVPETVLVTSGGIIAERWGGLTPAQRIVPALHDLLSPVPAPTSRS